MIYDQKKKKILKEVDLEKGYLTDDFIEINHEAVEEVKEVGHYEYNDSNVKWVVETPGVKAQEAYTEKKSIQVYIPYTKAELEKREKEAEIERLKDYLSSTDYVDNKLVEALILEQDTAKLKKEYADVLKERQAARDRINELE